MSTQRPHQMHSCARCCDTKCIMGSCLRCALKLIPSHTSRSLVPVMCHLRNRRLRVFCQRGGCSACSRQHEWVRVLACVYVYPSTRVQFMSLPRATYSQYHFISHHRAHKNMHTKYAQTQNHAEYCSVWNTCAILTVCLKRACPR